jgi:hypothetical protein
MATESLRNILRHRAWIIVGLTILLVFAIRVRLRQMPLERDEGEYAYAGQLILHGVPPYKEAYNMKLPGTYAAYALIMAVFGQTASAIHIGVALINAASILLIFLIGRKILDEPAGVAAAISYALLSTSPSVLGLAGHATHFIVLPALAGTLLLLRSRERAVNAAFDSPSPQSIAPTIQSPSNHSTTSTIPYAIFFAGVLFGLAFLMKQHGLFFGIFGGLYLAFSHIYEPWSVKEIREKKLTSRLSDPRSSRREEARAGSSAEDQSLPSAATTKRARLSASRHSAKLPTIQWSRFYKELAIFSLAFVLPYLVTCLLLWAAGVFPQFTFWTISYARKYATALPHGIGNDIVRTTLDAVTGPNLLLWIVPWLGALLMAWERRLASEHRFLLIALLLCSFGSIAVGFYFRQHYFITLLPVLALLTGVAVSRAIRLVQHDVTIELFLAIPVFLLFGLGVLLSLGGNGALWFSLSPTEASENIYHTTLFSETRKLGDSLRTEVDKNSRVAVLGSEPEIYFYSRHGSATGYIYMYPLMETHRYAGKMQQEIISEIERKKPEYVVYVDEPNSWLRQPSSEPLLDNWWQSYWTTNLDLVQTIDLKPPESLSAQSGDTSPVGHLLVFKNRTPHSPNR